LSLEKQRSLQGQDRNLKGLELEEKFYQNLRARLEEIGPKNTTVISSFVYMLKAPGGAGKSTFEADFIIFSAKLRAVIQATML